MSAKTWSANDGVTTTVLIADDNPVIRQGLESLLESGGQVRVVGQASNGKEAIALARERRPDVVLLDVRMPITDGVSAAEVLSEFTDVLMLTYSEEPEVVTGAIRAGASGYLVHGRFTPAELEAAIIAVAAGETVLSPAIASIVFAALRESATASDVRSREPDALTEREHEIMGLVAKGLSNGAIASALFISEKTVKNHLNRAYAKLQVTTRSEAMATWLGIPRT